MKEVQRAHVLTSLGGVGLTMSRVRKKFCVPRLRKLTKRVFKNCWDCKRFQAVAASAPPPGQPAKRERTEGSTPYSVIDVDFAGLMKYLQKPKKEMKAYMAMCAGSLSQAVFWELLPSLETCEFIEGLKRLLARRGRPSKIYSDNGKTFVATASLLKKIRKDEEFHDFLSKHLITWHFNLSRAPWWGGQFERLIGVMKTSLYRIIGKDILSWDELNEVLLNEEKAMNRPLGYLEEDVQLRTLTPNSSSSLTVTFC